MGLSLPSNENYFRHTQRIYRVYHRLSSMSSTLFLKRDLTSPVQRGIMAVLNGIRYTVMNRYNNLIQSEMKNKVNFQLWQRDHYRYEIRVIEQVSGNGLSVNADRVSYLDDLDDMDYEEAIQFFNQQVYSA